MKEPLFTGAATALITPFSHGAIDYAAYDRLLERQLRGGISALVVTGTTGEASTLEDREKIQLWAHTTEAVRGRCKVLAGVGTNDTAKSVRLARAAAAAGVQGLLAVTPYYNKCTQEGLVRHYEAIAEAGSLPLLAYDVPSRTGMEILPRTCARLGEHPLLNGIKYAGPSLSRVARIRRLCGETFHVWCGNDDLIVPQMSLGAAGVISVLSNAVPEVCQAICAACLGGDFPRAARLQLKVLPLVDALFSQVNPIGIKAALSALGLCSGELRPPLTPMEDGQEKYWVRLISALQSPERS